jgi:hypothetical protein
MGLFGSVVCRIKRLWISLLRNVSERYIPLLGKENLPRKDICDALEQHAQGKDAVHISYSSQRFAPPDSGSRRSRSVEGAQFLRLAMTVFQARHERGNRCLFLGMMQLADQNRLVAGVNSQIPGLCRSKITTDSVHACSSTSRGCKREG